MIDKKTAKKIAYVILDAATVEEIALRFAALGLNFPDDPFLRCRLLTGYILHRKNGRNTAVAKELMNIARSNRNFNLAIHSPPDVILNKINAYAVESVDLTDQQADQIFYELIYTSGSIVSWRHLALVRYWRKRRKQTWRV